MRKDDDNFLDTHILRITTIASRTEKNFPYRCMMEMTYFLTTGLPPPQLRMDETKRLLVRSGNFYLVEGVLYHKGSMEFGEMAYTGMRRKRFCTKLTVVWQVGLWWPAMQKDAHEYYRQCDLCQRLEQPTEVAR